MTGCRLGIYVIEPPTGQDWTNFNVTERAAAQMATTLGMWGSIAENGLADKGRLGGLDFVRYRCTTSSVPGDFNPKKPMKTVVYMTKDGDDLLVLLVAAPVKGCDADFRLAESSILTLTK